VRRLEPVAAPARLAHGLPSRGSVPLRAPFRGLQTAWLSQKRSIPWLFLLGTAEGSVGCYLRELKLRSHYSKDADPVFAGKHGRPLGHRNATRRGFEPAADLAEIEGVSFHSLRGAFASRMISRGVDPVTLANLLGHEDARITLSTYAHIYDARRTDDAVRQAMAR
jgi:site-specific recombinase XerD